MYFNVRRTPNTSSPLPNARIQEPDIKQSLLAISTQLETLNTKIDGLAVKVNGEFRCVNLKIEALGSEMAAISERLDAATQSPEESNNRAEESAVPEERQSLPSLCASVQGKEDKPVASRQTARQDSPATSPVFVFATAAVAPPSPKTASTTALSLSPEPEVQPSAINIGTEEVVSVTLPTPPVHPDTHEQQPREPTNVSENCDQAVEGVASPKAAGLPTQSDFRAILAEIRATHRKKRGDQILVYKVFFGLYVRVFDHASGPLRYLAKGYDRYSNDSMFDGKEDSSLDTTQYRLKHLITLIRDMDEYARAEVRKPGLIARNLKIHTSNALKTIRQSHNVHGSDQNLDEECPSSSPRRPPAEHSKGASGRDETGNPCGSSSSALPASAEGATNDDVDYDPETDDADDLLIIYEKFACKGTVASTPRVMEEEKPNASSTVTQQNQENSVEKSSRAAVEEFADYLRSPTFRRFALPPPILNRPSLQQSTPGYSNDEQDSQQPQRASSSKKRPNDRSPQDGPEQQPKRFFRRY